MSSKGRAREVWIDPGTFGASKACHVLADMMNRDMISTGEKHKVLSFLNKSQIHFRGICDIRERTIRKKTLCVVRDHLKDKIRGMPYSTIFKDHLLNVIDYRFKTWYNSDTI